MPGRRPKPTALRLLEGNAGKRPLNKKEPKPKVGVPVCPAYLSKRAKEAWGRIGGELETMGVLTVADGTALEVLVLTYDEWRTAHDALADRGGALAYDCETETGTIVRAYPEVAIRADAAKRLRAMLTEFGLTPSSRSKVTVSGKEAEDPLDGWLRKKN
jgi:P27 family predicted phage terminase small subunit